MRNATTRRNELRAAKMTMMIDDSGGWLKVVDTWLIKEGANSVELENVKFFCYYILLIIIHLLDTSVMSFDAAG